jgi:dynein heavy chain
LQFSLKAFSVVFNVAIERAAAADDVKVRVNNLTDCITHSVFMYTTRGLFEADKLIFTAQMAFQVGARFSYILKLKQPPCRLRLPPVG